MAWHGYFEYAGNEVINATRTSTYAANAKAMWFRGDDRVESEAIPTLLGHEYRTPLLDDAPWTDPDIPESYEFFGVYPLDIDGLENSTRSSTVVESTLDGGVPGRLRHGTKAVVFNVVLTGASEAAVEYGMRWLRQSLLSGPCGPGIASSCFGSDLCYLASVPMVDDGLSPTDLQECLDSYVRSLRKVVINSGPTLTARHETVDGGAAWMVTFTALAGSPYELGAEIPVVTGLLDPLVENPWPGGEEPEGGSYDSIGRTFVEVDCSEPAYRPIVDPLFPATITPPGPPSVPIGNFEPPTNWRRRQLVIPKSFIPLWGEVVPRMAVHARDDDLRNLRLRFYADPFLVGDISDDPCAYCGDIIVSYVPQNHSLIFDGAEERVYVRAPGGGEQRADSLVFRSDGTPFDWPVLSCGFGYIVTLDLPKTQVLPVIDLSLFPRAV